MRLIVDSGTFAQNRQCDFQWGVLVQGAVEQEPVEQRGEERGGARDPFGRPVWSLQFKPCRDGGTCFPQVLAERGSQIWIMAGAGNELDRESDATLVCDQIGDSGLKRVECRVDVIATQEDLYERADGFLARAFRESEAQPRKTTKVIVDEPDVRTGQCCHRSRGHGSPATIGEQCDARCDKTVPGALAPLRKTTIYRFSHMTNIHLVEMQGAGEVDLRSRAYSWSSSCEASSVLGIVA